MYWILHILIQKMHSTYFALCYTLSPGDALLMDCQYCSSYMVTCNSWFFLEVQSPGMILSIVSIVLDRMFEELLQCIIRTSVMRIFSSFMDLFCMYFGVWVCHTCAPSSINSSSQAWIFVRVTGIWIFELSQIIWGSGWHVPLSVKLYCVYHCTCMTAWSGPFLPLSNKHLPRNVNVIIYPPVKATIKLKSRLTE